VIPVVGDDNTVFGLISCGVEHTCGIKQGQALCWGLNEDGEMGDGTLKSKYVPTPVKGGGTWLQISAGDWHSCGLKSDRTAWCWGYNGDGRAGTGGKKDTLSQPTPVKTGGTWKMIDSGFFMSCGVKTNGYAYCWGKNNYGRLGTGKSSNASVPTRVDGGGEWAEAFAGGDHSCGRKMNGDGYCWGSNDQGQLGVGKSPAYSLSPVQVPGKWKSVIANGKISCGIKINGNGYCWGSNKEGQLGTGKTAEEFTPKRIIGGGKWAQLSPGQFLTCGIKTDNSGWCWGTGYTKPLKIAGSWAEISAGDWNACGIRTDGTAWCWWENSNGEGGVGKIGYLKQPTQIVDGTGWL